MQKYLSAYCFYFSILELKVLIYYRSLWDIFLLAWALPI